MAQDMDTKIKDRKSERINKELQDFTDAYYRRSKGSNSSLQWI